jgi:hypothetical protein
LITSALSDTSNGRSPSQRARFLAQVAAVEAIHDSIPNPVFQDAKDTVNRAFERAWDVLAGQHVHGRMRDLPTEVQEFWWQFNTPSLHTVPGYLKRAQKANLAHPACVDMIALLTEMAPLAALFAALKSKVSKRQPKPVEERKDGYHPPAASTETERQVIALLEQITEADYEHLKGTILARYTGWVKEYVALATIASDHDESLSPRDYYVRDRRYPSYHQHNVVEPLINSDGGRIIGKRRVYTYTAMADWQDRLLAKATREADDIRNAFVHKNFRKIASIIEAKGNYATGTVQSHNIYMHGLTGTLVFSFHDGSRFTVVNQVVYVVNQYGTAFNRFPLTFHDVVMADGKPMGRPSEERMNTIFVGKA